MKNRSVFSLFTLILVIFGLFAACSDPSGSGSSNPPNPDSLNPNPPQFVSNYTVKFEANGGNPAPDSQTIASGGKVVQPLAMTKTGYGFGGWYKDADCTSLWDFATDTVTGNITLYAKWDVNYHTVSFNANGGSPAPDSQTIASGGKIVQPPSMTKTGYGFVGWYKEAAYANKWNFASNTVSDNITLYAKWDTNYYTVKFNTNGGSPTPAQQTITHGGTVVSPPAMTKIGYGFGGWYKEAACINEWNFATDTVTGSITLYAKWEVGPPIIVPGDTLYAKLLWLGINAASNSDYILEVTANETLGSQDLYYIGKSNITIQLKGIESSKVIALSGNGSLFSIMKGVTLILGENLILSSKNDGSYSYDSHLIKVNSEGKLVMNQGVKISDTIQGGVYIYGGIFTMNGGEISGNTTSSPCGGVYINAGGTFTMSGGKISGNSSSYNDYYSGGGGGVMVASGTFVMSGGEISGNTTTSTSGGGGVYVGSYGTFTMSGGEIFGNSSPYGGGVMVRGHDTNFLTNNVAYRGAFTMTGGNISGNTSTSGGGGGVYVANGRFDNIPTEGIFTKSGGTITGYVSDTMNGNVVKNIGVVQNNKGHAVYAAPSGRHRETTAGPMVNLDSRVSGAAGGWE